MKISIGDNLKRLCKGQNITQEELAASLGISFQAVSKWERGDTYPDITMLPALANFFSVTTAGGHEHRITGLHFGRSQTTIIDYGVMKRWERRRLFFPFFSHSVVCRLYKIITPGLHCPRRFSHGILKT